MGGEHLRSVLVSNSIVAPSTIRSRLVLAASILAISFAVTARPLAQRASPFAPLPLSAESPSDNPSTPEKVELGRLLFWDPILSGGQDIACATCHHPDFGYTDGRPLPIGTGGKGVGPKRTFPGASPLVKRNSPTILNVAFNGIDVAGHMDPAQAPMFWDSRTRGLEAQALAPIESLEEMRGGKEASSGVAAAVARVARVRQYQALFQRAFGGDDAVTALNLSRAIAAFERTLITPDSRFDRYLRGDRTVMNEAEVRGMAAFESRGCALCHNGPMLSDYQFHVLAVTDNPLLGAADPGADGHFAFRTPTLRNLAHTAPYFHGGMTTYLDEAVGFYRLVGSGGGQLQYIPPRRVNGELVLGPPVGRDKLDPLLRQVNISSSTDFSDIIAFLGTLDGTFDRLVPSRVPSGLRPGGR